MGEWKKEKGNKGMGVTGKWGNWDMARRPRKQRERERRKGATSASDRRGIKAAIKLTSMVFVVLLMWWPLPLCRGQNQSLS